MLGVVRVLDGRRLATRQRLERPVRLIFGALVNPTAKQGHLLGCELLLAEILWRHTHGVVAFDQPQHQFAVVGVTRHDRGEARFRLRHGELALVEPQSPLALFLIQTMTIETAIRQQRPDVAIEIDRRFGRRFGRLGGADRPHRRQRENEAE